MRLVKLSDKDEDFPDEKALSKYFDEKLHEKSPPGRFIFGRQIAADGLRCGETILFSYRNRLRYVAEAETGSMDTTDDERDKYPAYLHYFVIKMASIREADVSLKEVERKLRTQAGLRKPLAGRGWNIIPDNEQVKMVIEEYAPTPVANDAPDVFPERKERIANAFDRDRPMARQVKELYGFQCQICGVCLEIASGEFYAEAHHLQPLGGNHNGPDVKGNMLCLCPNHHVLFDCFAIPLDPAKLRSNKHDLRKSFVDYHNARVRDGQGR
jgi:hypothetical protein